MRDEINKNKKITENKVAGILKAVFMNLKDLKIKLPKGWQETSRFGNENQFSIWINHISPLANIDSKVFQDQLLPSSSDKIVITKIGIPRSGSGPLSDFYDQMKAFILTGFAPPEVNLEWLEKVWKGMTKTPDFERPGESDLSADISVTRHQTEEIAKQSFKNMALMPTKGFNVPVPGGVQIPGMPKDMTITELLGSNIYEKYMSGEQLKKYEKYIPKKEIEKYKKYVSKEYMSKERLEKIKSAMEEVQEKIPEVKQDFLESGIKFKERKYLGYEAIYMEAKNPRPKPKSKPISSSRKTDSNTGMGTSGSGGGYTVLDPLPKISQSYQGKVISYQAILVKNYIILGSLLWIIASLPLGNTPCYSLTKTKEKIHFIREGGIKYKYIDIVPVVSNYAKEGYFYREEIEGILKKIIARL